MDSGWTLLHSNSSGAAAASEPTSLCAECACLRVLNNALLVENAALTEEINETAEKLENLREHHRIVDNSYSNNGRVYTFRMQNCNASGYSI